MRSLRDDNLLRRVILASAVILTALVTAAVALAALWIIPLCEKIETQEAAHRKEIVHQAFRAQVDRLSDLTRTYAVWDDAYAFARGGEPDFTQANFSAEALEEINVGAVLIFSADDRLLYSSVAAHAPISKRLMLSISGAAAAAPGLALTEDARTAVVTAPGEAALVTAARIARSDGTGQSPGRVVFVRRVDEAMVQRLEMRTDTPLTLVMADGGASRHANGADAYVVEDAYGQPALHFAFPTASSVTALGGGALLMVAAVTTGALVAMAWAFAHLLVHGVVRPVGALVAEIDQGSDFTQEMAAYRAAPAEISKLRSAFAEASRRLREEIEIERAATEEAQRARAAAEIANRARSHFLGRVSHEFRTPLHAIINYGELLDESLAQTDRSQDRQDLERMIAAARLLLNHVNDLIDIARLESGRMPLSRNEVDIGALIRQTAEEMRVQAETQKSSIDLRLEPDLGVIISDEQRLGQCLSSLVSNAVKFAPGCQVVIAASRGRRRDDDSIVISVSDNGAGMSSEQLDRAFQPFMQADEDGHLKHGGLGLGLTIARGLVELLGGRLDAESEPGMGARFRIILPVDAASGSVSRDRRAA